MYCSGCGSEINKGLNFCKSCGVRVSDNNSDLPGSIAKNFSIALGFIGTFGLVGFVILVKTLLEHGVSQVNMIVIAFLYLTAVVGLGCFLIINILKAAGVSNPADTNQDTASQLSMPHTGTK